jgi:hypothetical protein
MDQQLVDTAREAELVPISFKQGRERLPRISEPYVAGKRSSRWWTEADDQVIRDYYPTGGYIACAAHLPAGKRDRGSIYRRAHMLGVKSARSRAERSKSRVQLPTDLDDQIRAAWPNLDGKKRGAVNALADELKVPRWVVSKRARDLGLALPHRKEPPWTKAEEALLASIPLHNLKRASQIFREHGFRRGETAIKVRATRRHISRRFRDGFSAYQAAEIVGFDPKNLGTYCISGELKATKRQDNRLPQQGGARWVIKPEDLRRFVLDNLERIDLRKVEKFAFVKLLTIGSEPVLEEAKPAPAAYARVSASSIDAIRKQAAVVQRLLRDWV